MTAEIIAAIQSVRLLGDMAQKGYEVSNANQINSAIAETLAKLNTAWTAALEAQEQKAALAKRVGDLEKEVAQLKDWKHEAERHHLSDAAPSVPAYVLKPGMEQGEPPYHLCANCFARNEKSFLQRGPAGQWKCSQCRGEWFSPRSANVRVVRS